MGIGLGIDGSGIFLDTSGINAAGEEVVLDLNARLTTKDDGGNFEYDENFDYSADGALSDHTKISGTIGFLTMDIYGQAGVDGSLGLDIQDADGDGQWRGEGLDLAINASAVAYADFFAEAATTAGAILPSMSTFVQYDQILGNASWSSNNGFNFETGAPEVVLYDVTLDAGSLFDSFLGESLSIIKDIIDPIRPAVELLTMEVDLGITAFQIIDLAYLRLPAETVDTAKKVLNVLKATIEFIDSVEGLGGTLNFGDFYLTEQFLGNPDSQVSEMDTMDACGQKKTGPSGGTDSTSKVAAGPDQKGLDKKSTRGSNAGKTSNTNTPRFRLPILDDPASALGLLTGKAVDLFYYDLPDLGLAFEYQKSYPIYPGLNAIIGGSVGVETNFDFGFDTSGFIEFQESGYEPSQAWRIMNGFFLDDHGAENTDSDLDEVILTATIFVGASLGIGGLV